MIISSCILVATNSMISFFFKWLSSIPLYICITSLFTYDGHLGCLPVLAIANSDSMNTGVRVYSWIRVLSGYMSRSGTVESLLLFSHQACLTLCDPMDHSTPGLPVPPQLPKFVQVHVHCISDAVQPPYPLMPSSPSALNLSQNQGFFRCVGCSHQVNKILPLQHQSF